MFRWVKSHAFFLLLLAVCGYLIHVSYHKLTVRGYELSLRKADAEMILVEE